MPDPVTVNWFSTAQGAPLERSFEKSHRALHKVRSGSAALLPVLPAEQGGEASATTADGLSGVRPVALLVIAGMTHLQSPDRSTRGWNASLSGETIQET